jgi:colanic acid/amylovoran biosynthesis glycosyltransferase
VRVCYVVNLYPKLSHSFIRREIRALERRGVQVQRIAFRGWESRPEDADDATEQQQTFYTLSRGGAWILWQVLACFAATPWRFLRTLCKAWRFGASNPKAWVMRGIYFAEGCVVARQVRSSGATHVHAHFGTNSAEVAAIAAGLARVPFSFTVHGPEEFDRPQAIALPEKIRRACRVVAISSFGRSQLFRWAEAADWRKVAVVHCGVDDSYLQADATSPPEGHRLVCVGRICEQKGQLLLVDALVLVRDRGLDCHVVFAGDGPLRAELEHRARDLGVADRILVTGWIDGARVRQELAAARSLVLPSFAEGLPVVIMEALAMARPVISTYIAGIPELVVPGDCGWLVPAGDAEALADAMVECLQAPKEQMQAMGEAGRRRVLERHDASREAGKLQALFDSVARERELPH